MDAAQREARSFFGARSSRGSPLGAGRTGIDRPRRPPPRQRPAFEHRDEVVEPVARRNRRLPQLRGHRVDRSPRCADRRAPRATTSARPAPTPPWRTSGRRDARSRRSRAPRPRRCATPATISAPPGTSAPPRTTASAFTTSTARHEPASSRPAHRNASAMTASRPQASIHSRTRPDVRAAAAGSSPCPVPAAASS